MTDLEKTIELMIGSQLQSDFFGHGQINKKLLCATVRDIALNYALTVTPTEVCSVGCRIAALNKIKSELLSVE